MQELNEYIFRLFFGLAHQNSFQDALIVATATYLPYILFIVFLFFALSHKDRRARLFVSLEAVLAVLLARGLIVEGIRFFWENPRPFAAFDLEFLVRGAGHSFPSGHASILFALATTLYFFNRRLGGWFFLFAFLNGLARIAGGAHWPFDIAGGIAVGVISGLLVHKLLQKNWMKLKNTSAPDEEAAPSSTETTAL